jgi:hypothetical protein
MTGKMRRPGWDEESDMSEASTILITFSEDGDYCGEGEEAYERILHWYDSHLADENIWSEEDEIPLAKLKASQPHEDSADSTSEEDNIPLSLLKWKLENQASGDGGGGSVADIPTDHTNSPGAVPEQAVCESIQNYEVTNT